MTHSGSSAVVVSGQCCSKQGEGQKWSSQKIHLIKTKHSASRILFLPICTQYLVVNVLLREELLLTYGGSRIGSLGRCNYLWTLNAQLFWPTFLALINQLDFWTRKTFPVIILLKSIFNKSLIFHFLSLTISGKLKFLYCLCFGNLMPVSQFPPCQLTFPENACS